MSQAKISFCAVGDITLGDHPMCVGFGANSRFKKEVPEFPFARIKPVLEGADLSFGNLECSHSEIDLRRNDLGSVQMRGAPRQLDGLVDAGMDIVNVANNHSMQHGNAVFLDSIGNLEARGIRHCGVSNEDHSACLPTVVEKDGVKIAFFGYSLRPRQYFEHAPLYAEGEQDGICRDIGEVRNAVDIVIVSLHWGDEFIHRPSPAEMRLARAVIDAGANLIIGHHPHVLRGVEKYRDGHIVYSLGNFVCDMAWDQSLRDSLVFCCDLGPGGIDNVELLPVRINSDYQPELLEGEAGQRLLDEIDDYSRQLNDQALDDFDVMSARYQADADLAQRENRSRCHRYFLFRIYKFPIPIVAQQFATYFRNRFHELAHGNQG